MKQNKYLALSVVAVLVLVLLAAIIWPLSEQRNRSIDRAIENDFGDIADLVDEYFTENGRLPDELDDVKLSDEASSRAKKYSYELDKESRRSYELCAEFKTDTTDLYEEEDYYYSSYYSARSHLAGFDCIDYEVNSYYYGDDEPEFFFNDAEDFDDFETETYEL